MEWCKIEQCCVAPGGRTDFSLKRPRRGNLASTVPLEHRHEVQGHSPWWKFYNGTREDASGDGWRDLTSFVTCPGQDL
eukprot:5318334-Pleurochrysis_carterae.AAC.1